MEDEQMSEQARQRAAQYARQPSLWTAPKPATPMPPAAARRPMQIVRATAASTILLLAPPWFLSTAFGNPVAVWSSWWETHPFTAKDAQPTEGLRVLLIWAGWLTWLLLVILLAGSIAGAVRGRRLARWHLPMPLHRLIMGLTGTATVAITATPAAAAFAAPPAHTVTAPDPHQAAAPTQPGPATASPALKTPDNSYAADRLTVAVGHARYSYRVRRGDTLSKIAKTWLNDPDRWPDICALNKHHHVTSGQKMTDCDLIYPGWYLRLPQDAVAPPDAGPHQPPRTPPTPAAPSKPSTPAAPDPSTDNASPTPSTDLSTHNPNADTASDSATPSPNTTEHDDTQQGNGADLVLPGGSIIPWALATAITTTAALLWFQRRRRFLPGSDGALPELPAPVTAAVRHTRHATAPARPELAPVPPQLPSGGFGLIGSGADGAARGLIITAITNGTPIDPARRAEVIIDRPTLTALIGDTPIGGWSRLHITDSLHQALVLLDTHLLRRARILDEHDLTDIDTLRDTALSEETLPPLLFVTQAEQAAASNRLRITAGITQGLDITTVVLGHWPHGPAVSVSDDGHAEFHPGQPEAPTQLAVLDIATTRDLLDTTREAHTGQTSHTAPPTATPLTSTAAAVAKAAKAATENDGIDPRVTSAESTPDLPTKARLRVLGKPRIDDITAPGRPLRAKALELAVYLAVHPDGAATREIGEYLEPDARVSQADQRVHTNASNLRHVLGRTATADTKNTYLIKTAGRYRLDPDTVDVDLWTLRRLMRDAAVATEPRRRDLLTAACSMCTETLAEGRDYEWIQPHRETVRRWGTEAHLLLADDLLDTEPQAASDLLDKAIALDRYNEALYTKAMHARHALADPDGIRTLLRALTKALADLDAEPQEETIELAHTLVSSDRN